MHHGGLDMMGPKSVVVDFAQASTEVVRRRPLDLLMDGQLDRLIPDIHDRPVLEFFLREFLLRTASDEQRAARKQARQQILETIECAPHSGEQHPVRMAVFDVDHTIALLYPISSGTGSWALERIIERHDLQGRTEEIFAAARTVEPEFLCHAPHEFMRELAKKTGIKELAGYGDVEFSRTNDIMRDWRDASDVLNQQLVFSCVLDGIRRIKDEGGQVHLATLASPANTLHRVFLWFGQEALTLLDGLFIRAPIPGMAKDYPFASPEELAMTEALYKAGKVHFVADADMKPKGLHIKYAMDLANSLLPEGAPLIKSSEVVMVGDSLGSDGGAAKDLENHADGPAHFFYIAKGLVTDPEVLRAHDAVGHVIDRLGIGPVLDKIGSGKYVRPSLAAANFHAFFGRFWVVPTASFS